jgi:hypothetical protein
MNDILSPCVAIDFVTHELTIAGRANAWITTEDGNLTIEQIEKLQ